MTTEPSDAAPGPEPDRDRHPGNPAAPDREVHPVRDRDSDRPTAPDRELHPDRPTAPDRGPALAADTEGAGEPPMAHPGNPAAAQTPAAQDRGATDDAGESAGNTASEAGEGSDRGAPATSASHPGGERGTTTGGPANGETPRPTTAAASDQAPSPTERAAGPDTGDAAASSKSGSETAGQESRTSQADDQVPSARESDNRPEYDGSAVTVEMPQIRAPAARQTFEVRTARNAPSASPPATPSAPTTSPPVTGAPSAPPPTRPAPDGPLFGPANLYGPADRPADADERPTAAPRHMRPAASRPAASRTAPDDSTEDGTDRRRLYAALAGGPVIMLVLLIVAWTVDTTILSGQVVRNVEVAGRDIGGKSEDSLPEVMSSLADELAARPVTITVHAPSAEGGRSASQTDEKTYTTTAAQVGLAVDQDATIEAALDEGRGDSFFVRPLQWLASFFSSREVPVDYMVNELQTVATLQALQGADLTASVEPTIQLNEAGFVAVPGRAGLGIDSAELIDALPEAAVAAEGTAADEPIVLEVVQTEIQPRFTDEEAQALADRANTMTAQGLTVQAGGASVNLTPELLRGWITPATTESGLDLALNRDVVNSTLPGMVSAVAGQPVNASVTLEGGRPVVRPGTNGVSCCGDDADTRIWDALNNGQTSVELQAEVAEPEWTTAEVEAWGVAQAVGGSRGWQNGAAINGPAPGFTTYHNAGEARVTNIHRIADLVRGAVIPPGGTFSVNEYVGPRTRANGFVEAGAIRNGVHVPEVGGGVSQFATTMFNAAYFAGLDITEYQSHSESFPRYPRGREATMGYPNPDLVIANDTPYGVLIWTSYTGSSLTITMYSTPYATAEQTAINETPSGQCTVVITTRTRTYPNGTTDTDTFRSTYRPGENLDCNGQQITPTTTTTIP